MVQCRCYGLWNPIYYVLSATAFSLQLPNWIDSWNIYDYCFVLVLSWLFMYRNWRAKLTTHIGTKLPGIRSFFFSSDLAINSLSGQAPRTLEVKCNTLLEERGKMDVLFVDPYWWLLTCTWALLYLEIWCSLTLYRRFRTFYILFDYRDCLTWARTMVCI